jgi:formylglycine-generating enzyme required for sulfatase activity
LGLVLLGACACSDVVRARPQLLVVVDTTAPLAGQTGDEDRPRELAVDTLRVDLIARDGSVSDFLDVVAPETSDWPLSFGVAPEDADGEPLLLRLRLFSGAEATTGDNAGQSTIEPETSLTIDRLMAAEFPVQGIRKVRVLLDADCVGRPARFSEPMATCVSADDVEVHPTKAFEDLDEVPTESRAGSWKAAVVRRCSGAGPDDAVCIPGGVAALGERQLAAPLRDDLAPSYPRIPVVMSPFWMDRTEFSVGRLRELVKSGAYSGTLPIEHDPNNTINVDCDWLGETDASNDELPVNCISALAAENVCNVVSGQLPSEAQWEYAARGRGAGRLFPWGSEFPACCSAALARIGSAFTELAACSGLWIPPVGSFADPDSCDRPVDVSRDGVLDLAGSVAEATLDAWVPFDDPVCWGSPGLKRDPVCHTDSTLVVRRGGDWVSGMALARTTFRNQAFASEANVTTGFRCVYEDEP